MLADTMSLIILCAPLLNLMAPDAFDDVELEATKPRKVQFAGMPSLLMPVETRSIRPQPSSENSAYVLSS